ncbi:lanthionine synthetase C family protein [Embleya sp. AB8]|uniref:lanthionine synthetase C family protein n=1 Tax=Embleya sp. AB8 TaxID=3156304 RepID=UPI003C721340
MGDRGEMVVDAVPTGWMPVVSGSVATAALARVAVLAGEPRATPRRVRYDLGGGGAGLAVVCRQLHRWRPGQGWDAMAERWLAAAEAGAGVGVGVLRSGGVASGLWGGSGGLEFAGWVLGRDFDPVPRTEVGRGWDRASGSAGVGREFDLVYGLTGVCTNLLCRVAEPGSREALRAGLAVLVRSVGVGEWPQPGLAHGVSGPLALMSLAYRAGVRVPGQAAAIERAGARLVECCVADDWGPNWPAINGDSRIAHGSWCVGAAGIARALWLAGEALGDADLRTSATDALAAVLARPARERLVDKAPGLCHGLAGLLQITLRFAVDTGDPGLRGAATRLTEELLDRHPTTAGPGLLDGAAGVILALLAATTSTPPSWDRALLLA